MPFLAAKPLLGLTWASTPIGSSINSPVPTILRSNGFKILDSDILARKSIPAEAMVS